jgi:hypothetical protein
MSVIARSLIILLALAPAVLAAADARGAEVTFTEEYTYRASDMDSKVSSRAIALQEVKRALLEKVGTYLIVETEVREYRMTKDQVSTLSAGVVSAEVLREHWNGATYYLQAKITVDPDVVARQVKALGQDRERARELEESRRKADAALKEVARLRAELDAARSASGARSESRQKLERQQTDRALRYAHAVRDLGAEEVFKGFLFTMKDGSTFIWKQYEASGDNYCQELSSGRICIAAADVASIRKGEYPEGAEVISTPPLDERSRQNAEQDWRSTRSSNEKERRFAECQRMFDQLQQISDHDRYREEYQRYQKHCSGVAVDRSSESERRAGESRTPAPRPRGKSQSDLDRIMQNANDATNFD